MDLGIKRPLGLKWGRGAEHHIIRLAPAVSALVLGYPLLQTVLAPILVCLPGVGALSLVYLSMTLEA